MNKLTTSENVNGVTITTLEIAEMMNTPHYEILKKLEGTTNPDGTIRQIGIIPTLSKGKIPVTDYFIKSVYKTGQKRIVELEVLRKRRLKEEQEKPVQLSLFDMNW